MVYKYFHVLQRQIVEIDFDRDGAVLGIGKGERDEKGGYVGFCSS
jgi:hypothetical protein